MAAHEPLARRRELLALALREFGKADLAARPEHVVLDDQIVDRRFLRLAQRVIGGAHIGELGLAGAPWRGRRHRNREQHAEHDRNRHVGGIGVPQAIAETVEPSAVVAGAEPVVLVEVRDVADLRDREPPPARRATPSGRSPTRRTAPRNRAAAGRSAAGRGTPAPRSGRSPARFPERSSSSIGSARSMPAISAPICGCSGVMPRAMGRLPDRAVFDAGLSSRRARRNLVTVSKPGGSDGNWRPPPSRRSQRRPSTGCRCGWWSIRIFDLFMPKADASACQDRARRAHPGRETSTLACEWGLSLHLESATAGRRNQYLLDFGFTPEIAEPQFRSARHRAGKARRADPEPFAPRPLRRAGRLRRAATAPHLREA